MSNYRLKVSDFIYPREIPVRIITTIAAIVILAIVMMVNIGVGLFFLVNIALLFFLLYQSSVSRLGTCVRVSPTQFPRIYQLAQIASERLDINMPPVYIQQSPNLNAFASGFWGNFYIILTSALVEGYTDEELLPIIGHEFTHIKGNHVILTNITQSGVGLMKLVWWLQLLTKYVFMYLSRCQEYTCDRGALIASGNIQAFITAFTKLAVGPDLFNKINIMEFYKQVLELDRNRLSIIGEMESTHPYTVNRIREAVRFYRSDKYRQFAAMQGKAGTSTLQGSLATGDLMEKILKKPQGQQMQNQQYSNQYNQGNQTNQQVYGGITRNQQNTSTQQKPAGFCKKCGTPVKEGSKFCVACGTPYGATAVQTPPAHVEEDTIPIVDIEEVAATGTSPISSSKTCKNCGYENNADAVFCNECGQKF